MPRAASNPWLGQHDPVRAVKPQKVPRGGGAWLRAKSRRENGLRVGGSRETVLVAEDGWTLRRARRLSLQPGEHDAADDVALEEDEDEERRQGRDAWRRP